MLDGVAVDEVNGERERSNSSEVARLSRLRPRAALL